MGERLHGDLTKRIIGIFYKVYNSLGYGFLEKIYENALALEFRKAGLDFVKQAPIRVLYEGEIMGEYFADFIVAARSSTSSNTDVPSEDPRRAGKGKVVVEVKALKVFGGTEEAQLINYLKATGVKVGLLLNFGKEAEVKRRVF